MSIEKQTIVGLKWNALSRLTSQLINWAITLVVLRLLAPSDYGLMAILSVFIGLLANIAELGLGSSLVQARTLSTQEIESVTGLVIVANAAAFLFMVLVAPLIAWFYSAPRLTHLTQVAALQFLFNALCTVPQALAYREMQFGWLALVDMFAAIAGGGASIALAWHGAGVWALVLGNVVQGLVRALLLSRGKLPRASFRREGMRSHVEFGSLVTVLRLVSQLVSQSDIIIAGRILNPQAIGLYSVSLHVATLPMQKIMGTVNMVAYPAIAKLQHERERLRQRMLEATRLLLLVAIPLLWGMSATAPELVEFIMGPKWSGATRPLQVVCLVVPLQMLNAVYSTAALGLREMRVSVYNQVVSALVLPAAFFIGAKWGVNGLAYAWLVAIPAVFVLRLPGTIRTVNVTPRDLLRVSWVPFAAAAVMYVLVSVSRFYLGGVLPGIRLALLVLVGVCGYVGATLLVDRQVVPEVRRFLAALRGN